VRKKLSVAEYRFDCESLIDYVSGDLLPTAEENQTDAMIAYLKVSASSHFELRADSISKRRKYICKLSGRLTVILFLGTVENHENTEAVFSVFFVNCRVFRVF